MIDRFFEEEYIIGIIKKIMCFLRFFIILALCLMSFFANAEKLSSKFKIPVEKYNLNNGLRVLLNPDKRANTASYNLGVAVGSRHERPGLTGISHMFEHLMFRGTKKYPDFNKVYGENGVVGVNAFTSHDYTAYHASFPPEKLELILDVESDRMINLTLDQEILDKERGAVQEERLLRVDNNPSGLLFEKLFGLIFIKHPYRHPVIGYAEDISSYSLQDLKKWYETYYSPNNAMLVISGKFSVSSAKKGIEKYFGSLASKEIPEEIKVVEPEPVKARSHVVNKNVQAASVKMAYFGPPLASRSTYALEVISHILGSGESSLLYKKMVREKKLLPSIGSWVWDFLDHSVFVISYTLPDISREEEVKKLILDEVKQGLVGGISPRALEKVRNIQANTLVHSLKKSSSRAGLLLDYELRLGDYKKLYEKLDTLKEMSPEFIKKTGEKYLDPKRLSYAILKPLEKKK